MAKPSQPSACRAAAAATRAASAASMALKVPLAAWVSVIFQRLAAKNVDFKIF